MKRGCGIPCPAQGSVVRLARMHTRNALCRIAQPRRLQCYDQHRRSSSCSLISFYPGVGEQSAVATTSGQLNTAAPQQRTVPAGNSKYIL